MPVPDEMPDIEEVWSSEQPYIDRARPSVTLPADIVLAAARNGVMRSAN
jgi:hypothetical protein